MMLSYRLIFFRRMRLQEHHAELAAGVKTDGKKLIFNCTDESPLDQFEVVCEAMCKNV